MAVDQTSLPDSVAEQATTELTPIRAGEPPPPLMVERWQPSGRGQTARYSAIGAIITIVLIFAAALPDIYTNLISRAAVFAIVALSLNILVGYTGQVSIGHAAFFGVGAFAAGYGLVELNLPWLFGLAVAAISGAIAALLLGVVALRVKGLYLALVTIAYGLFAQNTIFNFSGFTGGGAGRDAPRPIFGDAPISDLQYAYVCIAFLIIFLVLDVLFAGSKAGRAVRALRDDERVAASWGINVTGYKLLAFVLSGLLASVAGGLFASIEQIVAPADFQFQLSITFLLMTVVGGAGNRWGVVQGGILFAVLANLLEAANTNFPFPPFSFITASAEPLIAAVLLLLVLTLYPGGIAQIQQRSLGWLGGKAYRSNEADPLTEPPRVMRVAGADQPARPAAEAVRAMRARRNKGVSSPKEGS